MKTRSVVLGEIADTCLGKMLDQKKNKGEYQPYLANVNVRWGGFDLDNLPEMRFLDSEEERYGLRYGDILVCEGGEPGRCAIWKEQIPNMKFQKALHRVRVNPSIVDFRWLFYRFLLAKAQGEFDQYFSGTTTIKHMPGDKLVKIRLDLPELSVQKKIGEALTSFDDLIETNQRQIKLLEEAARRLYKEWFVDLRYPGHQNARVVDGVPEGWRKCILGELFEVVRGKSYSSTEISGNNGMLMVNLSNIRPFGGYNRQQEKVFNGKYKQEQLVRAHDLIMGVTDMTQEKRTVGRVALIPDLHSEAIISMDLIKLIPKNGSTLFFYAFLLWGNYSEMASRFSNGTNVLHLRPEVLNMIDALLPSNHLQDLFVSAFSKIVMRIDALQDEIILASEARNRLLPKLMSGEITV